MQSLVLTAIAAKWPYYVLEGNSPVLWTVGSGDLDDTGVSRTLTSQVNSQEDRELANQYFSRDLSLVESKLLADGGEMFKAIITISPSGSCLLTKQHCNGGRHS